jgi:hypothetical protein
MISVAGSQASGESAKAENEKTKEHYDLLTKHGESGVIYECQAMEMHVRRPKPGIDGPDVAASKRTRIASVGAPPRIVASYHCLL